MFKVNDKDTRTGYSFVSLTIKTQLVSLLLTLNIFHTSSDVSIVNFEQVNR